MHDGLRGVEERPHRVPIRHAPHDDANARKLSGEVALVAQFGGSRVGRVREVVDDDDVVAPREEGARDVVADEAHPARDYDPHDLALDATGETCPRARPSSPIAPAR